MNVDKTRRPEDAMKKYEAAVKNAKAEDRITAGLEFRAACTVDGRPVLRESDLQAAVGVFGGAFLAGDLSLVPLLRKLDRIAASHDGYARIRDRIVRALRTLGRLTRASAHT